MICPRKMKITIKEHIEDTQHEQTSLGGEQEKSLKDAQVKSSLLKNSNGIFKKHCYWSWKVLRCFPLSVSISFCIRPQVLLFPFQNVVHTFACMAFYILKL